MTLIGNPYWHHGPLVFGPRELAERFARDFAGAKPVFAAMRKAEVSKLLGPKVAEVLGVTVLLLRYGTPTRWVPMASGGVFLRPQRKLGNRKPESYVVPTTLRAKLDVGDDWVLFDSVSGAEGETADAAKRARDRLPVPLTPGRYIVEHSVPAPLFELEYEAVRLRPEGEAAPAVSPVKKKPGFAVDAATKKQAKALRFIESDGGPFVGLPVASVPQWRGCQGKEGETDYDRVCDARNYVLGKSEGLVLPEPNNTAVLPFEGGVVFVHWVGADDAVDLLAALPHAKRWKRSKVPFEAPGPLVLFDSGEVGRSLGKRNRLEVPLEKGTYDIDTIEVQGEVEGGGEVMAGFTRLTRR